MGDLLIRDLPAPMHEELKRRAEESGMSLQAYVTRVLERHTATPSVEQWLARLEELRRHAEISGAETVRAARDELP